MEVNTSYGVVIASAIVCCILVLRRCCCTSGAKAAVAPATSLHSAYAMKQLLGAAMLIFAFWLQVPYTYKALAENHIVGDDIVGASYIICWLGGATIFGTLVSGPLADYFGHQEVCAMSCLLHMMSSYLFQCTSHCQEIPIFGSLLSGIAIAVLINTIEVWFAHDFLQKGCQPHLLLPAAMGRNVLALATVAVLSNMLSSYVVLSSGFNPRFLYQISIPVFLLASVWIGYCCDGELPVHGKQGDEGPGKNMPDFSDLLLGSVKSAFSEGPALAMAVTQFLVEVSAMVVIFAFSYDMQWRSDLNLPLEYAANLALLAVGAAIFQSYFSAGDSMRGSLKGLKLSSMCLFMATTIFTASWQHLIGPTWHFFGVQVQLVPIAVLLVHFSVGLYLPASASLRAYLCPNSKRASILGWMRVPVLLAISIAVASIMTGKFTSKILPMSPLFALMSMPAVGRLQQVLQTSNIATSLRK